jgi:hypothetical protein
MKYRRPQASRRTIRAIMAEEVKLISCVDLDADSCAA